jgi:hypothetical protein
MLLMIVIKSDNSNFDTIFSINSYRERKCPKPYTVRHYGHYIIAHQKKNAIKTVID